MIMLDALRTREGSMYMAGAAVTGLVAVMTLASTATCYIEQQEIREAVLAFAQGRSDARAMLGALRSSEAGDDSTRAAIRVMLASYNYDRAAKNPQLLDAAEKLYEEALQIDPGRPSAAIGLACVSFSRAEIKDRDARRRDADAALSELERRLTEGSGTDLPDVAYLKGAGLILQGKADKALALLDDPDPSTAPSLEGTAARYWNQGVAELLAGDSNAGSTFAVGYAMRPFAIPGEYSSEDPAKAAKAAGRLADPPKLLSLAWRVSLSTRPKDTQAHQAVCEQARKMMVPFYGGPGPLGKGQAGRFLPHRRRSPLVRNALGLGFFHVGGYAKAVVEFTAATRLTREKEPLFLQNLGWALYESAHQLKGDDKATKAKRKALLKSAAERFIKICRLLHKQKGREGAVRSARTNCAAIFLEFGDKNSALSNYKRYAQGDPDEVEWRRDLGALYDHRGKLREAKANYRKAIDLQHPDASELEQRLAELEAR